MAYRPGGPTIDALDAALAETPRRGLWLDTSYHEPFETVAQIIDRSAEAIVDGGL